MNHCKRILAALAAAFAALALLAGCSTSHPRPEDAGAASARFAAAIGELMTRWETWHLASSDEDDDEADEADLDDE